VTHVPPKSIPRVWTGQVDGHFEHELSAHEIAVQLADGTITDSQRANRETIHKRASGNCASNRFPSRGCKEAHYPHTWATHRAVFIGVSIGGWMIGPGSSLRMEKEVKSGKLDLEVASPSIRSVATGNRTASGQCRETRPSSSLRLAKSPFSAVRFRDNISWNPGVFRDSWD
jgi:hypothetical protein